MYPELRKLYQQVRKMYPDLKQMVPRAMENVSRAKENGTPITNKHVCTILNVSESNKKKIQRHNRPLLQSMYSIQHHNYYYILRKIVHKYQPQPVLPV